MSMSKDLCDKRVRNCTVLPIVTTGLYPCLLETLRTTLTKHSISFDNVFTNREGMDASYQQWARLARYGGRLELESDLVSDVLRSEYWTSDKPSISIQAVWRYKCNKPQARSPTPRTLPPIQYVQRGPKPMTWSLRVQHAIVDGEQGAITLKDDISQRPPFMKAMARYALYETLSNQGDVRAGQFGTSRIHEWGLDEPNDEPPYVGTRHLGEAVQMQLPPPYSE